MALIPGKVDAYIVSYHGTYAFAQDAGGTRYFLAANAVEHTSLYPFEALEVGAPVRLRPIRHPRGWRGIEVEVRTLDHPLDGR